ncbi:MAG: rhodanese-related sulfurtransferase [Planctomycetota bacterium]
MVVKAIFIGLLFSFLLLVSCKQPSVDTRWVKLKSKIRREFPTVRHMSVADLSSLLTQDGGAKPILLDVRDAKEYAVSHLPGAYPVIAESKAFDILKDVDKSQLVVAYCSVGYRSSRLAEKLIEAGYSNVFNLEGSIFEWANRGHAVFRGDSEVSEVHPYDEDWGMLLNEPMRRYEVESK